MTKRTPLVLWVSILCGGISAGCGKSSSGGNDPAPQDTEASAVGPEVTVASPAEGRVLAGTVEISGTATTGTRMVQVAAGEAAPFTEAQGTESWTFLLRTEHLTNGSLPLRVRAIGDNFVASPEVLLTVTIRNIETLVGRWFNPDADLNFSPGYCEFYESGTFSGECGIHPVFGATWQKEEDGRYLLTLTNRQRVPVTITFSGDGDRLSLSTGGGAGRNLTLVRVRQDDEVTQ